MGKMPDTHGKTVRGSNDVFVQGSLEFGQLVVGQGMERALQNNDGFAKAGVQVVV
jgi:NADH dehydrogenase FAD-containing subunit